MTRLVVDHLISPMMIQPTSIRIKLLCNHPLFCPPRRLYCTSTLSALVTNRSLSARPQDLGFVKSTPSFQRVRRLIGVTDNLCLGFFNVRFQNCAVVPDRRQDLADSPDRCIQIVVRLLPLVQGMEPHRLLGLFVCVV